MMQNDELTRVDSPPESVLTAAERHVEGCGSKEWRDLDPDLQRVFELARERVDGCQRVAISLIGRHGGLPTLGTDDPRIRLLDQVQTELGVGPGQAVIDGPELVVVADLARDRRWPAFADRAVALTDFRALISFRLAADGKPLGVLTLYSDAPHAFDPPAAAEWGRVLALYASLAISKDRIEHNLRAALESREVISVAMGILMARENIARPAAFDVLRRASQRSNMKLVEVARRIAGPDDAVTSHDPAEFLAFLDTLMETGRGSR
jgi:hypothetical protein